MLLVGRVRAILRRRVGTVKDGRRGRRHLRYSPRMRLRCAWLVAAGAVAAWAVAHAQGQALFGALAVDRAITYFVEEGSAASAYRKDRGSGTADAPYFPKRSRPLRW